MKTTEEKAQIMLKAAKADPPFSNLQQRYVGRNDWYPHNHVAGEPSWDWGEKDYRIKPDPIAPGHNPDRLTVSQVGGGWRLLTKDEIVEREPSWDIEGWWREKNRWDDSGSFRANDPQLTYRTQQPPGYFLPKPEPKKGVVKMWRYFVRFEGKVFVRESQYDKWTGIGDIIAKQLVEYPYIEGEGL